MLDTKLIEKALALTGNTMEYMSEIGIYEDSFSIEKFCYYLLSPEFIEKYKSTIEDAWYDTTLFLLFGEAINEYQLGNSEPLTDLLSKI